VSVQRLGGFVDPGHFNARVSLSSTLPVPTSDIVSAFTVCLLPYKGDKISLYDGSGWNLYSLPSTGLSYAPSWPANST
jgi:hypothetical protein